MKLFLKIFLWIALLYAVHLFVKFSGVKVPLFFSSYFADLLCMPFVMILVLLLIRLIKKDPYFQLSISMIVFVVIYTSLVFEGLLPQMSSRFTSDFFDVVFYIFGAVIFFALQRMEQKERIYESTR